MKPLILIIFLFSITQIVYSQVDSISKINLETIIRSINPKGTIVYTNRVSEGVLSKHFRYLRRKKINGISSDTKKNSISLTKQERAYLLSQLQKCFSSYWKDSLFAKSKLIELDSTSSFSVKKHKEIYELRNSKYGDSLRKLYSGLNWEAAVFSFSDIIYLRNKSIFLNYCMWYDGHGGAEDLYFYRKVNGVWKKWILVSGGDW
jgi:hypothetical protein